MKTKEDLGILAITMNQIARRAYRVLRHSDDLDEVEAEAEAYAVLEAISLTRGQLPDREVEDLNRWLDRVQTEVEARLHLNLDDSSQPMHSYSNDHVGAV